jgi:hypothetical protein
MLSNLTLYTTEGCHLCEAAQALLVARRQAQPTLAWEAVDIANDDALFERYGWSIPVLRRADGRELAWPFDAKALADFLAAP